MRIVILVCLVMVMFLWLLGLLGAHDVAVRVSGWLAWFACLFTALLCIAPAGWGFSTNGK